MIPAFIERAMADEETLEVWGPGDQASDFMHVDDCVNAILKMVELDIDGPVNIGTGRGATADEVAKMVMAEIGIKRAITHRMDKPYGPRWRVGDPSLLHTFYKPTISLEDGVRRVVHAQAGVPLSYGPGDDLA
jgi:nucleoside-diphosphate-sugar epimerase